MNRMLAFIICSVVSLFISCTMQPAAGTEIENERFIARVLNPDGSGATNATVTVLPVTFIPTKDGLSKKQLTTQRKTTDDDGYFDVSDLEEGCYNIYSEKGTLAAFNDSVYISANGIGHKEITLDETSLIRGMVSVQPNHDPRIAEIQILGTYFYTTADSSGFFEFVDIAEGEYRLRCIAGREGYSVAYKTVQSVTGTADTILILLDYLDIPIVEGMLARFDTTGYFCMVTWNKSFYRDLYEYVIFRDIDGNIEPSIKPYAVTSDTFFIDSMSPELIGSGSRTYRYRVAIRSNSMELGPTYGSCKAVIPGNDFLCTISTNDTLVYVGDTVTAFLDVTSSFSPITEVTWLFDFSALRTKTFSPDESIREYADTISFKVAGSTNGTVFCEITNSIAMRLVDSLLIQIEQPPDNY